MSAARSAGARHRDGRRGAGRPRHAHVRRHGRRPVIANVSGNHITVGITGSRRLRARARAHEPRPRGDGRDLRRVDRRRGPASRSGGSQRRSRRPATSRSPPRARRSSRPAIAPEDLDLVVVATATPDMLFPATAAHPRRRRSARRTPPPTTSSPAARASSTRSRRRTARWRRGSRSARWSSGRKRSRRSRTGTIGSTCILFGDGAGAVVVEPVTSGGHRRLRAGSGRLGRSRPLRPRRGLAHRRRSRTSLAQELQFIRMNGGRRSSGSRPA